MLLAATAFSGCGLGSPSTSDEKQAQIVDQKREALDAQKAASDYLKARGNLAEYFAKASTSICKSNGGVASVSGDINSASDYFVVCNNPNTGGTFPVTPGRYEPVIVGKP